jgi:hypothetical protein
LSTPRSGGVCSMREDTECMLRKLASQSCGVRLPWRMGAAHPCDTLDQPDSAITWHLFLLATIQLLMSWVQPEIIWSYGVTGCTMDSESSDRGSNPRRTSLPLAMSRQSRRGQRSYPINLAVSASVGMTVDMGNAETQDRTGELQIFSLTLSQLSYRGPWYLDTTSLP